MKKLVIAAILLMASAGANAQLLWKVSGNGSKGDSYIFGTHHVAPITMLDSITGTLPALQSVETMIGEVDMISDPEAMQQITMQYVMAPADSTLSKVMTPEEITKLNAVLAKYSGGQLTAAALEPLKPAMVSTQLAMLQTMVVFPGYNPAEQLDQTIQQSAVSAGKKIEGLESIESQFKILMGNPIHDQVKDLVDALDKDEESVTKAQELAGAYFAQDLDKIEELILKSSDMEPEDIQRLLTNRNDAWVKILKEKLPQETVFVAVGVGHLVGDNGLLNQLKQSGYTVSPVK